MISEPEGVLRNSQNFMINCSGNKLDEEGNRFVGSLNKILSYFQEVSQEKKLVLPIQGFAYNISKILYLAFPLGVSTSTSSPFLWPKNAFPSGDSFEMKPLAGSASDEPTMANW